MKTVHVVTKAEWSDDYSQTSQPCVILDGLHDWPAFNRWSPKYLQSTCGDRRVVVSVSHSGVWRYDLDGIRIDASQYRIPNVPLNDAADWIVDMPSGHKYYITQSNMRRYPELVEDLRFSEPEGPTQMNLWFGSEQTVTPLHYDAANNLFAQVYGTKIVTLFDPAETGYLYPHPLMGKFPHLSPVDVDSPDLAKYPLFAKAEPYVVTLEPGHMLFIPAFWWHSVRAKEVSISVNEWRKTNLEECSGRTAVRHWLGQYAQDGLCQYRQARNMGRGELIEAAERLLQTDVSLAVIPAAVAVEDVLRWPRDRDAPERSLDKATRDVTDAMIAAVSEGREVSVADLVAVIQKLQGAQRLVVSHSRLAVE